MHTKGTAQNIERPHFHKQGLNAKCGSHIQNGQLIPLHSAYVISTATFQEKHALCISETILFL